MKVPKITAELKQATIDYIAACAHVEAIRPIVIQYQTECLRDHPVHFDQKREAEFGIVVPELVTDLDDIFRGDELSVANYHTWLDDYKAAYGFVGLGAGICPLLVAENDKRKAARRVLDAGAYLTPHHLDANKLCVLPVKDYEHAVEITVNLVVNLARVSKTAVLKGARV